MAAVHLQERTGGARPLVLVTVGTRPEAIKLAPVLRALHDRRESVRTVVVNTGQHPRMVGEALGLFGVDADLDLAVHRPGQGPNDVVRAVMAGLDPVVERLRPDALAVHGDTSSAMAAAVLGVNARIPVVHVEAGLRSGDRQQPWPEETNRRIITQCTDLHLAPTPWAEQNLLDEGVARGDVVVTGNTVVDALRTVLAEHVPTDPVVREVLEHPGRLAVATLHRRENWTQLETAAQALHHVVQAHPDLLLVIPVHPNPAVRQVLETSALVAHRRVWLCDPLDYVAFAYLLHRCSVVLTDSGGVQEEAGSLGVPVVVLREVTERPELLASGLGRLAGCDPELVVGHAAALLSDGGALGDPAPFGDGRAGPRCASAITRLVDAAPVTPPEAQRGSRAAASCRREEIPSLR